MTSRLTALLAMCLATAAGAAAASGDTLELRGQVTGVEVTKTLWVQLFSVKTPYQASAAVDKQGNFRFRELEPGDYTLAVVRRGLGEIRRTVTVTGVHADKHGVVHAEIEYSAAEAANSNSTGMVSVNALAVPDKARAKYEDGQRALERQDTEEAVRRFREAVDIAPKFAAAWNALGVVAFKSGDAATADDAFHRALDADPGAFDPAVNLGGLLLASGKPQDALVYNRRAADQRPSDTLANAQLGMNYFQLGLYDKAEPYLVAAERSDPAHYTEPQLFLAEIYRRRGDREDAVRELEALLKLHPDGPNAAAVRRILKQLEQ